MTRAKEVLRFRQAQDDKLIWCEHLLIRKERNGWGMRLADAQLYFHCRLSRTGVSAPHKIGFVPPHAKVLNLKELILRYLF
jgi:hypothetical protein